MYLRRDIAGRTEWATSQLTLTTGEDGAIAATCEWAEVKQAQLARALERGELRDQEDSPDLADLVALVHAEAQAFGGSAQLTYLGHSPVVIGGDDPAPAQSPADRIRERQTRKAEEAQQAARKAEAEREAGRLMRAMGADPESLDEEERTRAELLRHNGLADEGSPERRKSEAREAAEARIAAHRQRAEERAARAEEGSAVDSMSIGAEDVGRVPVESLR